jgi:hypothetical protein
MKFGRIPAAILACLSLGVAAAPMKETRIQALRSGAIVIDGVSATFEALNAKLAQIKAAGGVVLFYREGPRLPPTQQQKDAFDDVMNAQVPVEFHRMADFSDNARQ